MVKSEKINENLIRHFSDEGKKLLQVETGIVYGEAVDVIPCRYTYEEVDEKIPIKQSENSTVV